MEKRQNYDVSTVNIGQNERWMYLAGGAVLLGLATLRGNSLVRLAMTGLGGMLLYQGVTGHSPMYHMAGMNNAVKTDSRNASVPQQQGIHVSKSVTINKPANELYAFWRDFENLPRIMNHLEYVRVLDDKHSHWKAKAPAGLSVEWDAEIVNEVPNELIGWRSLPDAQIPNAGSVRFKPALDGRGTELRVELEYVPPAGPIGAAIAKLLGEEPSVQIEDDLRRFKQLMETGEFATVNGQPSGRANISR